MQYTHLTGYHFVHLTDLYGLQSAMKRQARACELLGTVLLSEEGINLMLAGAEANVKRFVQWFTSDARFASMWLKYSTTHIPPFSALKVNIKPEIITFKVPHIQPGQSPDCYLSPETLCTWYDTGKAFVMLDTRNQFEYEYGHFKNAISLQLTQFSSFPEALDQLSHAQRQLPIVTYCTGGVRCEKAAPFMVHAGFEKVYQLEGGILHYFNRCGARHFIGECFVFDDRVALAPTHTSRSCVNEL